jgi:hypothetical protein
MYAHTHVHINMAASHFSTCMYLHVRNAFMNFYKRVNTPIHAVAKACNSRVDSLREKNTELLAQDQQSRKYHASQNPMNGSSGNLRISDHPRMFWAIFFACKIRFANYQNLLNGRVTLLHKHAGLKHTTCVTAAHVTQPCAYLCCCFQVENNGVKRFAFQREGNDSKDQRIWASPMLLRTKPSLYLAIASCLFTGCKYVFEDFEDKHHVSFGAKREYLTNEKVPKTLPPRICRHCTCKGANNVMPVHYPLLCAE